MPAEMIYVGGRSMIDNSCDSIGRIHATNNGSVGDISELPEREKAILNLLSFALTFFVKKIRKNFRMRGHGREQSESMES